MTKEQAEKVQELIQTLKDTIVELAKANPLGGVPSGHVYAALSGHISLNTYYGLLDLMKSEKLIRVSNHLIIAL